MKCFILHINSIKESYYNLCEQNIYTARGSCCGNYRVFIFTEENCPPELGEGMSEQDLLDNMSITNEWGLL